MTNSSADPQTVDRDLRRLAPKFAQALAEGLNRAWHAGLDPVVFEARRTDERQQWLYAQGRTRPGAIVTHAPNARASWHFYGLAVDVISRAKGWDDPQFFHDVAPHLIAGGCDWGGDWETSKDLPHVQWGALRQAPSQRARDLYETGGLVAVWHAVGAV